MEIINIFTPSSTNIFFVSAITGLAGFAIGFLIKAAAIAKHKKRVIGLEDEMLTNHSRILELEKHVGKGKRKNHRTRVR